MGELEQKAAEVDKEVPTRMYRDSSQTTYLLGGVRYSVRILRPTYIKRPSIYCTRWSTVLVLLPRSRHVWILRAARSKDWTRGFRDRWHPARSPQDSHALELVTKS